MKNSGQVWALVLATERTEREGNSSLDYVLNRAARTAHRKRVLAVVTQTTHGIVMGLLRILQRDAAARVVLVRGTNPDAEAELNARLQGAIR